MAYTPGVARVCMEIDKNPETAHRYTIKRNTVAIVSDGTAVLGLGDIGPEAAMPVMEGKALLFKHFAGVDAFPICLNTKDPDEIIETVKRLEPTFGGINLEDIAAPGAFEIEERLVEEHGHPGLPRRPARHRDRHARRARERAEDRRQAEGRPQGRRRRRRRCGCGRVEDPHERRRGEHRRLRPPGRGAHGPRGPEQVQAVVRREHQPGRDAPVRSPRSCRARTCSSGCPDRT